MNWTEPNHAGSVDQWSASGFKYLRIVVYGSVYESLILETLQTEVSHSYNELPFPNHGEQKNL